MTTCTQCPSAFEVTQEDVAFLDKASPVFHGKKEAIPPPTLCPRCRMLQRLAQRNERHLYHRKCDLSGKQIISCYSIDKPFPVYENDEWYSDRWDAKSFGRDFDFSRTFFEQFGELRSSVPRMARILEKPYLNSDYCNTASQVKNCYLLFSSNQNEDCYYGSWVNQSKNCVDSLNVEKCELCYECVGCRESYALRYCRDCINCRDAMFLRDCQGCSDCFGCVSQVNRRFMVLNEQKTEEEYRSFIASARLGSASEVHSWDERIRRTFPAPVVKAFHGVSLENCVGDYLRNCRNAFSCFEANNIEDCRYCQCLQNEKSSMDHTYWGQGSELIYYTQACGYECYHVMFSNLCWSGCSDLLYCDHCFSSKDSFGCVGLRKDRYCILNKQHTKEEYERLVPRIIEHMRNTPLRSDGASDGHASEWAQYIPQRMSIYAYNESLAQEHEFLSRDEVLSRGWLWKDEEENERRYMGPAREIPDDISDAADDATQHVLMCEATGKPFKIIPQELKFYRERGIPLPRVGPDERHRRRLALRNPRKLWNRHCAKCQASIQTTYAPDRPEIVYCEACYLSTVY
jgi:hypothetical protein